MSAFRYVLGVGVSGSYTDFLSIHTLLSACPSQIGTFLSEDSSRALFFENFDTYVDNLLRFLEHNARLRFVSGRSSGAQSIACQAVLLAVSVLSLAEFDLVGHEARAKLVAGVLTSALPYQPSSLKALAEELTKKPGLLECVASSEGGARAIGNLFSVHFVEKLPSIGYAWADKLSALCCLCHGVPTLHGIPAQIDRWRTLKELVAALDSYQRGTPSYTLPPQFGVPMRRLSRDDRHLSVGTQRRNSVPAIQDSPLPDNIISLLEKLEIQTHRSSSGAEKLLDMIQDIEAPALVHKLLATFPCRPCYELSADTQTLSGKGWQALRDRADSGCSVSTPALETDDFLGGDIGVWKVLLSAEALKDIQKQMLSGRMDTLEARLRLLASGNWRGKGLSTVIGTQAQKKHLYSPLMQATAGKELRIIWQVDFSLCEDRVYRQHIKVWRVVDREDVRKIIDNVIMVWRSKLFLPDIGSVLFKPPVENAFGIFVPSVDLRQQDLDSQSEETHGRERCVLSVEDRRTVEAYNKFYAFTKPVLDSFLANNMTAEFPFDMSPEEIDVVKHNKSGTLIMGRSGTGKTTCLVQKLVRNHTAHKSVIGQAPPRQVLLTRSRLLAEKLRVYSKKLVESQLSQIVSTQEQSYDFSLGEEDLMMSKTLCGLKEEEFPLVCTSDQFIRLLEQSVEFSDRQNFSSYKRKPRPFVHAKPAQYVKAGEYVRRSQVVNFPLFRSEYWTQFPTHISKNYDVGIVFAEIMGIIKGSMPRDGEFGSLSRKEYLGLGRKLAPTFSPEEREGVYDLYLRYEKIKSRNGDQDGIDRVIALLNYLKDADPVSKRALDGVLEEVYVDEVQDQRCIDIVLLLKIIRNSRGIHFAGDSAQCISMDSTFRFNDLKAMFYKEFIPAAEAAGDQRIAHPELFKLTKNFRSHQGIISLASFVMNLLYKGFPGMVDKMDKERGQYDGSIPTMFVGLGAEVLAQRLVGYADVFDSVRDFGAEQVILVRDDVMKEKVKKETGGVATVLSILDSKGMEFDEVFLLDFFTSSPAPSGIRKLKNILSPGGSDEVGNNPLLCSELKHLYVAVTRPRIQLWILESDASVAETVVELLTENENKTSPLVEVVRKSDPDLRQNLKRLKPAQSSDPKKYSEMGYKLLQRRLFEDANICFRKAKDEQGQKISKAHMKMEEGRGHRGRGSNYKFLELFRQAVRLFHEASQPGNAAYCLEEMNCLEEAGDQWVEIRGFEKAASLYEQARSWTKAFDLYDELGLHADAARALRSGEKFDKLVRYLAKNRNSLEPSQLAAYSKLCTILLSQGRIKAEYQEFVIDCLGSDDEKEEFLRRFRIGNQLVKVLLKNCNYGEAFSEIVKGGKIEDAFHFALQHMRKDSRIAPKKVISLLHYVAFKHLLGILGGTADKDSRPWPVDLSFQVPAEVLYAIGEWNSLFLKLRERSLKEIYSDLESGLHRELVSITIVVHWALQAGSPQNTKSLQGLSPIVDALIESVAVFGSIGQKGQGIPTPFSIVMGAFAIQDSSQDSSEMWLMDYCLISDKKPHESPEKVSTEEVVTRSRNLFLEKMISLFIKVEEVARNLWSPQSKELCSRHFQWGKCDRQDCSKRHSMPSSDECKSRIKGLEVMCSLICSFWVVYMGQKCSPQAPQMEQFSKRYLPNKRYWSEYLLAEIIFRSAMQHDCEAATDAMKGIATKRHRNAAIFWGLEDLLFHRLRKDREWALRNDLSSIFEQLQLSEGLGGKVADRFKFYTYLDMKKPGTRMPQHRVFALLQDAMFFIEGRPPGKGAHAILLTLKLGLDSLLELPWNDFTCFHSIVGLFERLACFLLLWICPTACLLPLSWTKLHLPFFLSSPAQIGGEQDNREVYGQCLLRLLDSFREVIQYLSQERDFYHSYGTSKTREGIPVKTAVPGWGIKERSRDFLTISLVNLAAAPIRPFGSTKAFNDIQFLFRSAQRYLGASEHIDCNPKKLCDLLCQSFVRYGGKDRLIMVTCGNAKPKTLPLVFLGLDERRIPTHTLASLLKPLSCEQMALTEPAVTSSPDGALGYSPAGDASVEIAAIRIQVFWHRRWPYTVNYRASLATPGGKARAFVFEKVIKPFALKNNDGLLGILAKTIVLDNEGVNFYVAFWELREQFTKTKALSQQVLTNPRVSTAHVEELVDGPLMDDLEDIGHSVASMGEREKDFGKMYADHSCRPWRLRMDFAKARRYILDKAEELKGIEEKLEQMVASAAGTTTTTTTSASGALKNSPAGDALIEIAAIKIQSFWRRRWPYTISHRASLATPDGKARAFVFEKIIKPTALKNNDGSLRMLAKTIVLDNEGVGFYVAFWELREQFTKTKALSQQALTNARASTAHVENLADGTLMADLEAIGRGVAGMGEREFDKVYADRNYRPWNLQMDFARARQGILQMAQMLKDIEEKLKGVVG